MKASRITYISESEEDFRKTIDEAMAAVTRIGKDRLISVTEKEVAGNLHITVWYWL